MRRPSKPHGLPIRFRPINYVGRRRRSHDSGIFTLAAGRVLDRDDDFRCRASRHFAATQRRHA